MNNFFENQWVEVFRVGDHTDSSGRKRDWNKSDLEEIVNGYNAGKHEAPVVIGHPKDNAPAFGWVEALKTDGKTLFARFRQLVPEFVEAVKKGLYKKRSISLYPDLTLRHIGFLGAVPPALKGLADISFSENKCMTIEFQSQQEEGRDMTDNSSREKVIERLKTQLEAEQRKNRRSEFREFVKDLHAKGKMVSDLQNDVVDLMEVMSEAGEFNFSDGQHSVLDRFRNYLMMQPEIVQFGEAAVGDVVKQSAASEQLNLLTVERAKKDKISFSEALGLVQGENPDLAHQAALEI